MAALTFPTTGHTNGTHSASSTDADLDALYAWMPPQAVPQPCPEALFSVTLKGSIDGHETLLTARGMTAAEFKRNLEAIRGLLDPAPASPPASTQGQNQLSPQQHNAAAMQRRVSDFCQVHNVQMPLNTGKDGRTWYSHRLPEGGFCKGR